VPVLDDWCQAEIPIWAKAVSRSHLVLAALICDRLPWMSKGSFSTESTLEIPMTKKPGREVHRHWPDEVKAQIASES
jgi:hypothetical protein